METIVKKDAEVDIKEFLVGLFNAMYEELPALKSKKEEINKSQFVCINNFYNLNSIIFPFN